MSKVFCIGFHKTGTTSLGKALSELGYSVCGCRHDMQLSAEHKDKETLSKVIGAYDAFQDNPWPLLFRELDKWYPGSKFILTVRDVDKWYQSVLNHFGGRTTKMRQWIYKGAGDPRGNEDIYKVAYNNHNEEVLKYFADRRDDLLMLDFSKDDGWQELCAFLKKDIPNKPFPHSKKRYMRTLLKPLERIVDIFVKK
ncbi:MAG: sulfotransferase family protein [Patescibacteria group bacterium]